jgi:hypothetical protein
MEVTVATFEPYGLLAATVGYYLVGLCPTLDEGFGQHLLHWDNILK